LSISRGPGSFRLRLNIGRADQELDGPANYAVAEEGSVATGPAAAPLGPDAERTGITAGAPEVAGPADPLPADPLPVFRGQNCTVVFTDIVGFSDPRRTDRDRLVIRQATAIMTMTALGPLWETCSWADRGDGMLIIVPPGVPTMAVLGRLLSVLPAELGEHNARHGAAAQVQLRVAVEVGPVVTDSLGPSGEAIILAARMLEAPALKRAIAQAGSPLGVITSAFVFDTAVRNAGQVLGAADYVSVQVKVKNTRIAAWFRLVG
jgi:hypothetical protein